MGAPQRLKELESSKSVLENQVRERNHEISEVEAKLTAAEANLKLVRERLDRKSTRLNSSH